MIRTRRHHTITKRQVGETARISGQGRRGRSLHRPGQRGSTRHKKQGRKQGPGRGRGGQRPKQNKRQSEFLNAIGRPNTVRNKRGR